MLKMVNERDINKKTIHFKINHSAVDILLTLLLNNIENVGKLDEENFYLLDCLIKCKLLFCEIEITDDYSENVKKLLLYCKRKRHFKKCLDNYTYVYLTSNNLDSLINLLKDKIKTTSLLQMEEEILDDLISAKMSFYDNIFENVEFIKLMQEIEKLKIMRGNKTNEII